MNFFRNSLRNKKKGFTLIELIIVIAIIAVLVGLAIPRFLTIQRNSKIKTDIANGKTICNAVATLIAEDKLSFTKDESNSNKMTINVESKKNEIQSYLQTIPEPKLDNKDEKKYFKVEITKDVSNKDNPYDIKVYVVKDAGKNTSTEPGSEIEVYPESKNYGKVE